MATTETRLEIPVIYGIDAVHDSLRKRWMFFSQADPVRIRLRGWSADRIENRS